MTRMKAYRVPDRDTEPSDAMIDWLHLNPKNWEGDGEGIVLQVGDDEDNVVIASIGDWVIEIDGVYNVAKHEDMVKNYPTMINDDTIYYSRPES